MLLYVACLSPNNSSDILTMEFVVLLVRQSENYFLGISSNNEFLKFNRIDALAEKVVQILKRT